MKAYHVFSVNCNGTLNYITFSKERAMKDQCVFVQVNELEIDDVPFSVEQHNKLLTDVQALFNPVFAIPPRKENMVEIMSKFKDAVMGIEDLKK